MMNSPRITVDTDSRRIKEMRAGLLIIVCTCGPFWAAVAWGVLHALKG